ncbi:hypothetical protein AB836_00890 [Rickettsiales bacterium (ex Bugula neritina AB1)]|nr:hypothetical protein AB836_00890 [Rickettsiales bacterium (ex Bugula neritina AB1)]
MFTMYHIYMMLLAINEALKAAYKGFVPVGAVVVKDNTVLYKSHNHGRFKHVELDICEFVFNNNIKNYNIYITLEPCLGCSFFLSKTNINFLFFGSYNTNKNTLKYPIDNKFMFPLINKNCERILRNFFFTKRYNINRNCV